MVSKPKVDRKSVTQLLLKAATGYFVKKTMGVNIEVGVMPWGSRRVDLVALSTKGHVVIAEIKSSLSDLKSDSKMHEYIPHCNQMYLVVSQDMYEKYTDYVVERAGKEIGVLVLDEETGWLRSVKNASNRNMNPKDKRTIILRLAFRGAKFSKRNTRRTRVFIES